MSARLTVRHLYQLLVRATERLGFDTWESRAIARNLWEAELTGRTAHGVARLSLLRRQVQAGHILPVTTQPALMPIGADCVIRFDARGRTGWLVMPIALRVAAHYLRERTGGVAAVTLLHASPGIGYLGQYGRAITSRGLVLIMMVKSTGGGVPEGSTRAALGTNAICLAAPGPVGPIILDMSATAIPWNGVELARLLQSSLPVGLAHDEHGHHTENPHEAVGLKIFGGHRGTGLAIMIEVLAGALGSTSLGNDQASRWGVMALLVRAAAFRSAADYFRDVQATFESLRCAQSASSPVRYPGSEAGKALSRALKRGWVDLDKRVATLLDDIPTVVD